MEVSLKFTKNRAKPYDLSQLWQVTLSGLQGEYNMNTINRSSTSTGYNNTDGI